LNIRLPDPRNLGGQIRYPTAQERNDYKTPVAGVCPQAKPEDGHETGGGPEAKSPGNPNGFRLRHRPLLRLRTRIVLNLTSHALGHKASRSRTGGVREMSAIRSHPLISSSTRARLAFLEAVPFLSLLDRCLFRHHWTRTNGQRKCDNDDP